MDPLDSMRKGVAPRTAPSFREERMTRVRCTKSSLLVVGGGWKVARKVLADDMFEENVETRKCRAKKIRNRPSAMKGKLLSR